VIVDPFFRGAEDFFGLSLDELIAGITPGAWVAFERDEIDEATYLQQMFRDGRPVDGAALRAWLRSGYRYVDGLDALLDDLVAAKAEMHALSNYPSWYRLVDEAVSLSERLPWTFVSCRTGHRKPDPEAYLGAARYLDVPPEACVFVDDRGQNCKAAAEVGMSAIRFESAAALRADLVRLGMFPNEEAA
jgi:HAD superfamily hydrolase (TIGR01509 family)